MQLGPVTIKINLELSIIKNRLAIELALDETVYALKCKLLDLTHFKNDLVSNSENAGSSQGFLSKKRMSLALPKGMHSRRIS